MRTTDRRRRNAAIAFSVIAGCAFLILGGFGRAGASTVGERRTTSVGHRVSMVASQAVDPAPTGDPAADPAAPAADNTPQPTGRPLPGKTQRIVDSTILVLLLVVLAGTIAAALTMPRWTRSRRDRAVPTDR